MDKTATENKYDGQELKRASEFHALGLGQAHIECGRVKYFCHLSRY